MNTRNGDSYRQLFKN